MQLSTRLQDEGNSDSEIMFVLEAPTRDDLRAHALLTGDIGECVDACLESVGLTRSDIYITTMYPSEGMLSSGQPTDMHIVTLQEEVARIKPKVIFLFGNRVMGWGIQQNTGVLAAMGVPIQRGDITYIPMPHPKYFVRIKNNTHFINGLQSALTYTSIDPPPKNPKYNIINNPNLLNQFLEMLRDQKITRLGMDIETRNLDLHTDWLGIGFSYREGTGIYIPILKSKFLGRRVIGSKSKKVLKTELSPFFGGSTGKVLEVVSTLLITDFKITTFNGTFDLIRLLLQSKKYGVNLDFSPKWVFDVQYAEYLLNENKPKGYRNLETSLKRYSDLADYKDETKGVNDWGMIPLEKLAIRCCKDCDGTLRETNRLAPLITEGGFNFMMYKYMMPMHRLVAEMRINGIYIDQEYMNNLDKELTQKIRELDIQIFQYAGSKFNIDSDAQLGEVLFKHLQIGTAVDFTPKTGIARMNASHLELFIDKHPIIKLILERKKHTKTLSTYVNGWREKLIDGRIHSEIRIAFTKTGRPSSSNPNVQNPTRGGIVRSLMSTPLGYGLMSADVSQSEIRWLTVVSQDVGLIRAYIDGKDIHCYGLAVCEGMDYDETVRLYKTGDQEIYDARTAMKHSVSFGVIFGMAKKHLAARIVKKGESMRSAEKRAEHSKSIWTKTFSGVEDARKSAHAEILREGQIRNMYGQMRRLPNAFSDNEAEVAEALRMGFNFLMQGPSSIMTFMYFLRVWRMAQAAGLDARPNLNVHDSFAFETKFEHMLDLGDLVYTAVQEPPLPDFTIPVVMDVDYDRPWTKPVQFHIPHDSDNALCGYVYDGTAYINETGMDARVPNRNWCPDCMEKLIS